MNEQLKAYIVDNLAKGNSRHQIVDQLLKAGWQKSDIDASFPKSTIVSLLLQNRTSLILRIGLAFVFIYAAIFVSHPLTGGKYVPHFVTTFVPLDTFLLVFGIFEAILALWILTGKFKLFSGLIAASLLIGITAMNPTLFGTLFRNVAITAAAFAFAFL